jgi:hypothetical protein
MRPSWLVDRKSSLVCDYLGLGGSWHLGAIIDEVCHQTAAHAASTNVIGATGGADAFVNVVVGSLQGSVLSSLLCSLFLADIEHRKLRPLLPPAAAAACTEIPPGRTAESAASTQQPLTDKAPSASGDRFACHQTYRENQNLSLSTLSVQLACTCKLSLYCFLSIDIREPVLRISPPRRTSRLSQMDRQSRVVVYAYSVGAKHC